jgi:hypothetical protein
MTFGGHFGQYLVTLEIQDIDFHNPQVRLPLGVKFYKI